jgi:hypothetical protein
MARMLRRKLGPEAVERPCLVVTERRIGRAQTMKLSRSTSFVDVDDFARGCQAGRCVGIGAELISWHTSRARHANEHHGSAPEETFLASSSARST